MGLEDWELSRIRVNLLQQAGAHDLLERLSAMSPLPGHSGAERSNNFQKMFSKRPSHTAAPLQRCALPHYSLCFSLGSLFHPEKMSWDLILSLRHIHIWRLIYSATHCIMLLVCGTHAQPPHISQTRAGLAVAPFCCTPMRSRQQLLHPCFDALRFLTGLSLP